MNCLNMIKLSCESRPFGDNCSTLVQLCVALFYAQTIIFEKKLILLHGEKKMKLLKNKKALSTVVTTLIILVVSVLLATVVTFYAINVTTTRVQEESLHLTKPHVWYSSSNATPTGEAAIMIINTGGRDVVMDKITVRGQECDWTKVYYNVTKGAISADFSFNSTLKDNGKINIGGSPYIFKRGVVNQDLTLKSGYTLIVYIDDPDSIALNDIGVTCGITVFTANAQYYKESNVEATS